MPNGRRFSAFHASGLRREPARCLHIVHRGINRGLCDRPVDDGHKHR